MTRLANSRRLLSLAVIAVAALALPAMAQAEGHGHGRYEHGRRGRGAFVVPARPFGLAGPRMVAPHVLAPRAVLVPRAIAVRERGAWAPYWTGSAYYAPHRHRHELYGFPVVTPAGVVVRPYSYCGGHLFLSADVPLPHISIRIGF